MDVVNGATVFNIFDWIRFLFFWFWKVIIDFLGSKFEIMKSYRAHLEKSGYDTLFINGFLDTTSEKAILDAICADFIDIDNGESHPLKQFKIKNFEKQ